jgi:hypothetical protein
VAAPASTIEPRTSQCSQEELRSEVSIAGSHDDDAYEDVASLPYLLEFNASNPTEPGERERGLSTA